MSSNEIIPPGRPKETHIVPQSAVVRSALPLITSLALGEPYGSKMLNMMSRGVIPDGVVYGFNPEAVGGLVVRLNKDPIENLSIANTRAANGTPVRVFQQHSIDVSMISGVKNVIVLEGNYDDEMVTTQVSADSTLEPAVIRRVLESEVLSHHVTLCTVDLSGGETAVTNEMIDTSNRLSAGLDWKSHISDANPHPQYVNPTTINEVNSLNQIIKFDKLNVVTGDVEVPIPVKANKSYFRLKVIKTVDLKTAIVRLLAPSGEKVTFELLAPDSVVRIQTHQVLNFYRLNDAWYGEIE